MFHYDDEVTNTDSDQLEDKHLEASQKTDKGDTLFTSGTSEMPA